MALVFGKDSCLLKGRAYTHGSIVCNEDDCIECADGDWAEKTDWSYPQPEVHVVPGKDFSKV